MSYNTNDLNLLIMGVYVVLPTSFISMALGNIDWTQVATVVIAGFSIVFGVLLTLILIFYIFGLIVSKTIEKSKKNKQGKSDAGNAAPAVTPAPKNVAHAPAPVVQDGVSGEVVAAITAAIAASEGADRPFVIRSIKKKSVSGRNPWASAAVSDNTKPF